MKQIRKFLHYWFVGRWSRRYWEDRAEKLRELDFDPRQPNKGWYVGRTDMYTYLSDGGYAHYAYHPNKERVLFRGSLISALRKAVLFAEKMNKA